MNALHLACGGADLAASDCADALASVAPEALSAARSSPCKNLV